MGYYLKVFGCQMNQSDAERIATILEKYKLKQASSIDEANLVIFVTCGVRQSAEDRVYGQINNIRKRYLNKKIFLTGCLAHRKDVRKRLKGKVDLFIETKSFTEKINKFVRNTKYPPDSLRDSKRAGEIPYTRLAGRQAKNEQCNDYLRITPKYASSYTAYIPIMTGCDNFCSYCVVPYARGREYSRPVEDILREIKNLVKKGYKEIILLGQNVNSYRGKFQIKSKLPITNYKLQRDGFINFAQLLRLINVIPGKFWLTFLTSHPKDMSDELIKTIAKSKKICEYVNLPAQSGDNEILRKMNRHYTVSHYKNLIKKIRRSFLRLNLRKSEGLALGKLEPSVSTDIIVGFPGETKKQFENTAKLMQEIKFDMAYISQYSPRPETIAWKLKDNVSKKEKERREKVLTKILEKTALENNKKYVGKTIEVLVDKRFDLGEFPDEKSGKEKVEPWTGKGQTLKENKYSAHTRTQKKVVFYSKKKKLVGKFVKVIITKAKTFGLEGKMF